MKRGFEYAESVLDGSTVAGLYVRQACQRFMDDLQRKDLKFKKDPVNKVIGFIQDLEHSAGNYVGEPFILEPWEVFIVMNLYGFFWKNTGKRRFRTSYIEMARKQGKSALADALCLYALSYDDEGAAEVLLAANAKEQATEVYKIAKRFIKRLDPDGMFFRPYRSEIHFGDDESFFKVLASDDTKLDSYNCSFGVVDEYHSAPHSRVRDVIRSSQGMRKNPHLMTITTAGFDKSLPCYELRTMCTELLAGIKKDDSFFAIIYCLDEGDKWQDPKVWIKSNPNLGVTVQVDYLEQQVLQAINNPSDEVGIRTKNFNEWMDSKQTWIPDKYVLSSTEPVSWDMYKDQEIYIGVDLASVQDFTAVGYLVERDGKRYYKVLYYLPAESLKTRPEKELYKQWVRSKHLIITPGNVTDYDYVIADLMEKDKLGYIVRVAYDPYNATQWAIKSTNEGLPLEPFSQTPGNFNKATKEYERQMLQGDIIIDDNPITRYCLRNVVLRMDYNGNVKPDKQQEKKKIDGVISMLQCLAMWQEYANTYVGKIF